MNHDEPVNLLDMAEAAISFDSVKGDARFNAWNMRFYPSQPAAIVKHTASCVELVSTRAACTRTINIDVFPSVKGRSMREIPVSILLILLSALIAIPGSNVYPVRASTSQPWGGFRDDFNYTSIDSMAANGWTQCGQGSSQQYGVSSGSLNLQNGAAMCWSNIPAGVSNWTVTFRGEWSSSEYPSSGVEIVVQTVDHVYKLAAGEAPSQGIILYRDGVAVINSCTTWYPYCGWYPACGDWPGFEACYYSDLQVWHIYRLVMQNGVLTPYFNDDVDYKYVVGSYKEPDPGTALVTISPSSGSDIGVVWNYAIAAPIDPTTTSISCAPSSVAVNEATTCTATVADISVNQAIPTGTVTFTVNGTCYTNGVYWTCQIPISSCTLGNPSTTSASCSVTYTSANCPCYAWQTSPGTYTITASYNGDMAHPDSSGSTSLNVTPLNTTRTSVTCNPSQIVINQATSCTATVTDTSSKPSTPTGVVSPGGCTLGSATSSSASCTFTSTGTQEGTRAIGVQYDGDKSHYESDGGTSVIVNKRATSMVIDCSPNSAPANTTISCRATVTDTDVATPITPTGSIIFASNSTGTFSPTTCTLAVTGTTGTASCSVSYTPTAAGQHLITGTYQTLDSWGIWEPGDYYHNGSNATSQVNVLSSDPPATTDGGAGGRFYRI